MDPAERLPRTAIDLTSRLIRCDTSNYGDGSGPRERSAGEVVLEHLAGLGLDPWHAESQPRRPNIVVRLEGSDASAPALVVHGHLDVVPAVAAEWSRDPFGGEIDGHDIWGRGAVDMKDMVAMMLAVLAEFALTGTRPRRDLIFAFFSDEEAGGVWGSHWMVREHPGLFAGASEAISEVGGFSVAIAGQRAYLIQTAEKGLAWLRLVASGTAGHGSAVNADNAVTALAAAVARVGAYAWPMRLTPTVRTLLEGVAELTGLAFDPADPAGVEALLDALGPARRFVGSSVMSLANPTGLAAGYKTNVIPSSAEATVDLRAVPGDRDAAFATLHDLLGDGIEVRIDHEDIAVQAPWEAGIVDSMRAALRRADPEAVHLPYQLSGGTDNKALATLGIAGYGFVPLQLEADVDFTAMFHGVDERVPLAAVGFGAGVLLDFLTHC